MIVIILLFLLFLFLIPLLFKKKEPTKKYKNSTEILGEIGEYQIAQILNTLSREYQVFNDIYLSNNDITTQITYCCIYLWNFSSRN